MTLVSACANSGNQLGPNATAVDRANANFGQTVATGAVAGAAAGALLGALIDHGNRGAGAALGGLAGGALGAGAGTLVANNNVNQARTEDTLQGQIQAAQRDAASASAAAAEARQRAAEAAEQSRQYLAQYRAGQITAAQYQSQLGSSRQYNQNVQALVGHLNAQETSLRQQIAAAGRNSGPLQDALSQMDESKRSLQGSQGMLVEAESAVPTS